MSQSACQQAEAQLVITESVFGNGGDLIDNNNNRVNSTVGQAAIGVMSNANNTMLVGFWHVVARLTNTPPVADAGPDQALCQGLSVQIGGAPTGSGGNGGPYTFSWLTAIGLDDPTAENPNASPPSTTTYTITVTETATSLSAMDDMTVTVNPLPIVDAGMDQTIIETESVQIGGTPTASGCVFGIFYRPWPILL